MPLCVLCVAEKPSVARNLVSILSQQRAAQSRSLQSVSPYHPVSEVTINSGLRLPTGHSGPIELTVTAVSGHVFAQDFQNTGPWHIDDCGALFDATVIRKTPGDNERIVRNLQKHGLNVQQLWLWLDCDREGEAIAQEVVDIVKQVNPNVIIKRAIFNALTTEQVLGAIARLTELDHNAVKAVDARSELDLRLGAVFTRWQTLMLRNVLNSSTAARPVLSYGTCQVPTLKIVVQRYLEHYAFRPCNFWYLDLKLFDRPPAGNNNNNNNNNNGADDNGEEDDENEDADSIQRYVRRSINPNGANNNRAGNNNSYGSSSTSFSWNRRRLFDKQAVEVIYANLHQLKNNSSLQQQHLQQVQQFLRGFNQNPQAPIIAPPIPLPTITQHPECYQVKQITVLSSTQQPTSKQRPIPLNTIEFQQYACRKLGLTAHEAMEVAEKLYQEGFISYPRTETQVHSRDTEPVLRGVINELAGLGYRAGEQVDTNSQDLRDYSVFAQKLNDPNYPGKYFFPRSGRSNDNAHPPIHPIKARSPNDFANEPKKRKVYDFIVRHFLASCSRDAVGVKTQAVLQVMGGMGPAFNNNNNNNNNGGGGNYEFELFHGEGLVVKELNYLEITPWDRWSNKTIPTLIPGQNVDINLVKIEIRQGSTTGPSLHTESSLLAEMHRNGIGTDATMAAHINTLRTRGYLFPNTVLPTPLGAALVLAWSARVKVMASVKSRAELEKKLTLIAEGRADKDNVLREQIQIFRMAYNGINDNPFFAKQFQQLVSIALNSDVQKRVFEWLQANPMASNDIHAAAAPRPAVAHDNNNNNGGGGARGGRGGARGRGGRGGRGAARGDD